jgi:hypothetical protein
MKIILVMVFIFIDLGVFAWMVNQFLEDVSSITQALQFLIFPYWLSLLFDDREERRQSVRRMLPIFLVLTGLIWAEWWIFKKVF